MTRPHYAVLGAGISGLTLAWLLQQKYPQAEISVLEKSSRTGGWIESRQSDGFLFEMGPRSLRAKGKGAYTLRLVEELGLQSSVIKPDRAAHKRYLYEKGKLTALPSSLGSLLISPHLPLLLKAAWRDWQTQAALREDESIYDFGCRHFGSEPTERFLDPLILGIYAGDCRHLSVNACFPQWVDNERAQGSLLKAALRRKGPLTTLSPWVKGMQKEAIFSFKNGIETLSRALTERIDSIHLNTEVTKMTCHSEGIELELNGEKKMSATHVFSTLPSTQIHKLLDINIMPIPHASVAVVALGFNKQVLKHQGFGYLIPSREKEEILGMVWDSSAFPQQNDFLQTRLTVMIDAKTVKDYKKLALDSLARHLHIENCPDRIELKVAGQAIPQYPVGHKRLIESIQQYGRAVSPHLTLLGTTFNGVAVNDCIAQAFLLAENGFRP